MYTKPSARKAQAALPDSPQGSPLQITRRSSQVGIHQFRFALEPERPLTAGLHTGVVCRCRKGGGMSRRATRQPGLDWAVQQGKTDRLGSPYSLFDSIKPTYYPPQVRYTGLQQPCRGKSVYPRARSTRVTLFLAVVESIYGFLLGTLSSTSVAKGRFPWSELLMDFQRTKSSVWRGKSFADDRISLTITCYIIIANELCYLFAGSFNKHYYVKVYNLLDSVRKWFLVWLIQLSISIATGKL